MWPPAVARRHHVPSFRLPLSVPEPVPLSVLRSEVPKPPRTLGVSDLHVRDLIAYGRSVTCQVAGPWLVDEASLPSAPRGSSPMSVVDVWRLVFGSRVRRPKHAKIRRAR